MSMTNDLKNWGTDNSTLFFRAQPIEGMTVDDILAAAQNTAVKTNPDRTDMRSLMGACWDCAVVVRERLAFPASPHYADVAKVAGALKASLGDVLFEKFLRPNARVGLPPAK